MDSQCTVLLVDDSEDDAFLFERAILALGRLFRVVHVPDTTSASLYLKGDPPYENQPERPTPDLIVCDSVLGQENGVDLLEWVRVHPRFKHIPFVILSGGSSPEQNARASALGVTALYSKPPSFDELIETVRALLQNAPRRCHSSNPE
jgi:CheY-like chemotaxis protein